MFQPESTRDDSTIEKTSTTWNQTSSVSSVLETNVLMRFFVIIRVEDGQKSVLMVAKPVENDFKIKAAFCQYIVFKKVSFLRRQVKTGAFEKVDGKCITYCRFHLRLRVFWRWPGKVSCVTKGRNVEYGLWTMEQEMWNGKYKMRNSE